MNIITVVAGILLLVFGLKFLGSPLFGSLLSSHADMQMDYRWLPSIALFAFAVIVCVARINANARGQEPREAPEAEPETEKGEERNQKPGDAHRYRR
jgi:hypothetical protein